jgi:GT2 family glycosyltransferase
MPVFSVVIPTHDRRHELGRCLDALARQTLPPSEFEVIVVDDGSRDGTSEWLKSRSFPFALKVLTRPNGGASQARNAGVAAAAAPWIAFSEDDVVPQIDWLKRAAEVIREQDPDVVDGRTVDLESRRDLRRFEPGDVPSFLPCNLFVKRAALDRVGGYDADFYDARRNLYFREDAELGFRLLDAGFRVAAASSAVVGHPAQFTSIASCLRHGRRYVFDALLYKKHPRRYRTMIESKRVLGLPLHRPQYLLSLAYALCLAGVFVAACRRDPDAAYLLALAAFGCSLMYRFKYQGRRAFFIHQLDETIAFLWAPLLHLGSLIEGAFRYRAFGVLRPW